MHPIDWIPFYERLPEPGQLILLRQGNSVSTQRYEAGAYLRYYRHWNRLTAFWMVLGAIPPGHPETDPNTYAMWASASDTR